MSNGVQTVKGEKVDFLRSPWRWFNENMLVVDEGSRPVVIGTNQKGSLVSRNEVGLLDQFDPKSPIGTLIKTAPMMLVALEQVELEMRSLLTEEERGANEAYQSVVAALILARGE